MATRRPAPPPPNARRAPPALGQSSDGRGKSLPPEMMKRSMQMQAQDNARFKQQNDAFNQAQLQGMQKRGASMLGGGTPQAVSVQAPQQPQQSSPYAANLAAAPAATPASTPTPAPAAGGANFATPMKRGGKVKKMASGGMTSKSSASRRGDGIAQRGKTKGRYL